ncbi:MAG TPA: hypothetical protein VKG01_11430 [Thermoanaerobaculia bacterium]|nr:hypothetical protein [Thermoanaerobaculia bacterium]
MELNDHLREMLKELGQAINESISGSGRVHDSIQRIRDEGYNLYMVLDAKVGVNRRPARAASRKRQSAAHAGNGNGNGNGNGAGEPEHAAFRINIKDLRFLKSVGIDPTRKVRTRTPLPRRTALRRITARSS